MTDSRIGRYGGRLTSHDAFKLTALLLMTLDHIGLYLFPECLWLRAIGRGAFPLFFFLAGYTPSSRFRTEILWVAVIMALVGWMTYLPLFPLNALFAFILARWTVLRFASRLKQEPLVWWLAGVVFLIPTMMLWEYGSFAMLFAGFGYLVRTQPNALQTNIFGILTFLVYSLLQCVWFDFSIEQIIFIHGLMACVMLAMWRFTLRSFAWRSRGALILSRYSLYYYLIHVVALQLLAAYVLHSREVVPFRLIGF